MKHFINLKNIPVKDLRKIIKDAKKRKKLRRKLNTLEIDKGAPLKGKLLVQMFEGGSRDTAKKDTTIFSCAVLGLSSSLPQEQKNIGPYSGEVLKSTLGVRTQGLQIRSPAPQDH